jgi:hypothetical protein
MAPFFPPEHAMAQLRPIDRRLSLLPIVLAACSAGLAGADEGSEVEFFEKRIRPVLVEHCYKCHSAGAEKLQGKLFLDSREAARKGGETGAAIVPGDAEASLLLKAIRYEDFEMPPSGKLPAEVIADFERWIKEGAVDPREGSGVPPPGRQIDFAAGRQFWSFQPPRWHESPSVSRPEWLARKSDGFILSQLDRMGLPPAEPADRRTWLRRVTLDLVGLPPSPDEVAAFEADFSPDAFERVVDRLLAAPQHGERVARMWLDLARFAEDQAHIVGSDASLTYPNAYLYRDWVIAAINRDLPYDDFNRLQLAADVIEGDESPNLPALGLIGLGPKYYSRRSLQVMSDEWEDRVDIVGRGLLGLTVACARCHDHKFDPIGTEDYYALAGVFASTSMFNKPLNGDVEKAGDKKDDEDKEFENGKKIAAEAKHPKDAMHVVREGAPTDLAIFIRGNVENKGPVVPRHFLRVLTSGEPAPFASGSGRRELAEMTVSPENPLASRVIVNRMWGLYVGQPLVATPSNFGLRGELPTHPELLDDLAVRFMDAGWSLKWLAREIVLSSAYRQSSRADAAVVATDPENRLLSRMNRRRLTVEQWRDSLLAASGKLEQAIGGPSLDPQDPQQRRRTIYGHASRLELNRMLAMFDYPDPNVHADRRVETTTPLQKMFVLNSPFMAEQAKAVADRLQSESLDDSQRIELAYRLLYSRPPTEEELRLGIAFVGADSAPDATASVASWPQYAHVLLAANELLYVD